MNRPAAPNPHSKPEKPMVPGPIPMTDQDFDLIARFIESRTGIKMPRVKKTLAEGRLQKTLRTYGYTSFGDYLNRAIGRHADPELTIGLINTLTTNKTDFFREPDHFEHLAGLLSRRPAAGLPPRPVRVWSAACSTGEEPYTLAMVLQELKLKGVIPDFEILATDLSTRVLRAAAAAEYPGARLMPVPDALRKKYVLRHRDHSLDQYKIVKELRDHVHFDQLNLTDAHWPSLGRFDAIFCRNVFIYFERETQARVTRNLLHHLKPDGALYIGHSESLHGLDLPLTLVHNAVYRMEADVHHGHGV